MNTNTHTSISLIPVTIACFFSYSLMSAVISPVGILAPELAARFGLSNAAGVAVFSYLTVGVFLGSILAIGLLEWLRLKTNVLLNVGLAFLALLGCYLAPSLLLIKLCLGLLGVVCGVSLTAAAMAITRAFAEQRRAAMLLLTDSFYSMGGVISSLVASSLVAAGYIWVSGYGFAVLLTVAILLLAFASRYPEGDAAELETKHPWPLGIFTACLALTIYLLGFVSMVSWVPLYAQEQFAFGQEQGGQLISRFFLGMFIGQLVMFGLVLRFKLGLLIIVASIGGALINTSFWNVPQGWILTYGMTALGLVAGGLLKTLITYGTLLVKNPSTRLVSLLLFSAGLGTAIAPSVSAWVVSNWDTAAALQLSSACYWLTALLVILTVVLQPVTESAGAAGVESASG